MTQPNQSLIVHDSLFTAHLTRQAPLNRRHATLLTLILAISIGALAPVSGCGIRDPRFCRSHDDCADPLLGFCDLDGEIGGVTNTCIPEQAPDGGQLFEADAAAPDADVPEHVVDITAAGSHACVLSSHGNIRCWGSGASGQLGYGNERNIGDNELPVDAGNVDVGGRAVQVVAGSNHTCALLDTGVTRCWGDNLSGALGHGDAVDIGDDELPNMIAVDVGADVARLAAGISTCAILDTGKLRCWGANERGQLGYGHTLRIGDNETPASQPAVDVGVRVSQIAVGGTHTCALLENGSVRCWGGGGFSFGLAGYGDTNDRFSPPAQDVVLGGKATQIGAGVFHTCALLETQNVRCWGNGSVLGYGNENHIGDNEVPADAGNVNVGGPVAQIAAGFSHTCALRVDGAVLCWGANFHGGLGYGNTTDVGTTGPPAAAGTVQVGGLVKKIVAGGGFTCALLEDGAVRCWGSNLGGQLGYGHTNNIGDDELPASAGDVVIGF